MIINKLKNVILIVLLVVFSLPSVASPAIRQIMKITQKDGRVLTFYLFGDEHLSWGKTLDDYTILAYTDGMYHYATKDSKGNLVASSFIASDITFRTERENDFLSYTPKNLMFSNEQHLKADTSNLIAPPINGFPTTGVNPLLVILVNFQDRAFTYTNQDFVNMLSQPGYNYGEATGSVRDYYFDNSFGQLDLQFIVVGPVTLSHEMAYYGATGPTFSDIRPKEMISEACSLVDGVINFNDFDINGDSVLEALTVIFAGRGEAVSGETDAIWPHRWSIYNSDSVNRIFDGVKIKDYSCSGEKGYGGSIDGIGTFCHEFGHVLGLPDYYDADYGGSGGQATALSSWSIMASGSYNNNGHTPPIFNTNERFRMGWMSPDTLSTMGIYDLYPLIDSNKAYILTTGDSSDYYLIENRHRTSWDQYLPNNGMLIYHIKRNYGYEDCVNCNPAFQQCDIVEADNDDSNTTLATDVFTADNVNHYFTSYDEPHCFRWSDMATIDKPITHIELDSFNIVHLRYLIPDTNAIVKTFSQNTKLSSNAFRIKGQSVYDGINQNLTKGFELATTYDFDSSVFYAANSFDLDTFYADIDSLLYSTIYYYRATAINSNNDTVRGNINFFSTSSGQPYFSTGLAKNIDTTSFTLHTTKLLEGDFPITQYGIVYDTIDNKELAANIISFNGDFDTFDVLLNNLEQNTKYYCRPFVVTQIGKAFGNVVTATTKYNPIIGNEILDSLPESCPNTLSYTIIMPEISGGVGAYTYLWQQSNNNSSWQDANGNNTEKDYQIDSISSSTYFRRIVYSKKITDISNSIFAKVNNSVGGHIIGLDSVNLNQIDTLTLRNFSGNILSWQIGNNYDTLYNNVSDWNVLDNSADANKMTINYTLGGNFLIRAEIKNSTCPAAFSDSLHVFVLYPTGLLNIKNNNSILLTPNPTKGNITIKNSKIIATITIFNSDGKIVLIENNINNYITKIKTEHLPSGIYFITITNEDSSIEKSKFIKL